VLLCHTCMVIERCPASLHQRSNCLQAFPNFSPTSVFSVCSPVFSNCSPVFSKCSPTVLQLFSNCYRYVRSMLEKIAGVNVGRTTLKLSNEARHSFNSNRVSIHIVSGMPLPIACNCSIALRSGTCLAAHSGMQLILCLLGCSNS
jgi:hypothetical protein